MGKAIDFPERNDYIGKPPDMTDNQCYALPVCRFVTFIPGPTNKDQAQQTLAFAAFWQLSDEEIEEIIKNRGVWTKHIGTTLYPISVHGKKPIYPAQSPDDKLADHVFSQEELQQIRKAAQDKKAEENANMKKGAEDLLQKLHGLDDESKSKNHSR